MDGALARHLATRVHPRAHLVDVDVVGGKLQVLFLAPQRRVPFNRLHLELHHQVIGDLVARIILQLRQHLDGGLRIRANAHELAVEIRLTADINGQKGGIALERFRVAHAHNGCTHAMLLKG